MNSALKLAKQEIEKAKDTSLLEAEKRKNSQLVNELDECKSKIDTLDQKLRSRVKNYKSE